MFTVNIGISTGGPYYHNDQSDQGDTAEQKHPDILPNRKGLVLRPLHV